MQHHDYWLEYPEFVVWLQDTYFPGRDRVGKNRTDHLRRFPVAAAMFGSWSKNRHDATTFWGAVRDETGSSPDTPDRKLASFLIRNGISRSGKIVELARKAEPREFYVRCIHAWNAWRKEDKTDLRYYPEATLPTIK